jgi:uncharacterized OB-fold protein
MATPQKATEKKPRPVPTPTRTTTPFWDAAKEGRFLLQYDPAAGKYQFYPRPVSVYSGSRKLEWREASGRGKLVAHTFVRVPVRGFEDIVPFVLASVDLDEGVRVAGRLMGLKPDDVTPGMRVKICWEELPGGIRFFAFEPDA